MRAQIRVALLTLAFQYAVQLGNKHRDHEQRAPALLLDLQAFTALRPFGRAVVIGVECALVLRNPDDWALAGVEHRPAHLFAVRANKSDGNFKQSLQHRKHLFVVLYHVWALVPVIIN